MLFTSKNGIRMKNEPRIERPNKTKSYSVNRRDYFTLCKTIPFIKRVHIMCCTRVQCPTSARACVWKGHTHSKWRSATTRDERWCASAVPSAVSPIGPRANAAVKRLASRHRLEPLCALHVHTRIDDSHSRFPGGNSCICWNSIIFYSLNSILHINDFCAITQLQKK